MINYKQLKIMLMKRIAIAFVFMMFFVSAGATFAQSTAPAAGVATPDTSQLKQYVGTYTVATGDVKQIIITAERDKLVGEAVGLGQSGLISDPTQADTFIVPDPNGGSEAYATVRFGRDGGGKIAKVVLSVQGMILEGVRSN
jgi:hypothetical protein